MQPNWIDEGRKLSRIFGNRPMEDGEFRQHRLVTAESRLMGAPLVVLYAAACVALVGSVPNGWLAAWAALLALEALVKFRLLAVYFGLSEARQRSAGWRRWHWGGALYSGVVYGLSSLVLLLPLPQPVWSIVFAVHGGVVILFMVLVNQSRQAAILILMPLVLPLPIALILFGDPLGKLLGAISLVVVAAVFRMLTLTTRETRRLFIDGAETRLRMVKLEAQRREAQLQRRLAERAVLDKNRYIAAASHDVQQPLVALGLYQELLRRDAGTERNAHLFDAAQRTLSSTRLVFRHLIELSELDAGEVRARCRCVSLDAALRDVADDMGELARERDIAFDLELTGARVATDPVLLGRIVRNLLVNALENTEQGAIGLRVVDPASSRHADTDVGPGPADPDPDERVLLEISDTGRGIEPEDLERIFEEFERGDSPRSERWLSNESGTCNFGLGLSIVNRLCALLDIGVSLRSTPGKGTVFVLALAFAPALVPPLVSSRVASLAPSLAPGQ